MGQGPEPFRRVRQAHRRQAQGPERVEGLVEGQAIFSSESSFARPSAFAKATADRTEDRSRAPVRRILGSELKAVGALTKHTVDGEFAAHPQIDPAKDLRVTAGWSQMQAGGVVMPGQGEVSEVVHEQPAPWAANYHAACEMAQPLPGA
jgi:hypothetical protein